MSEQPSHDVGVAAGGGEVERAASAGRVDRAAAHALELAVERRAAERDEPRDARDVAPAAAACRGCALRVDRLNVDAVRRAQQLGRARAPSAAAAPSGVVPPTKNVSPDADSPIAARAVAPVRARVVPERLARARAVGGGGGRRRQARRRARALRRGSTR